MKYTKITFLSSALKILRPVQLQWPKVKTVMSKTVNIHGQTIHARCDTRTIILSDNMKPVEISYTTISITRSKNV